MKRSALAIITFALTICMGLMLCGCAGNTYTPSKKTSTVDSSALGKSGTLRVGVDSSNAPFASQSNGKIIGLDVDIAAALADEMGLNLEIVDVGTDADGSIKKGTVDVVMSIDKTDTSLSCWMSDIYTQSCVALFSKTANTTVPTKSSSPTIAAQTSSMSAWDVTNQFGTSALKSTSDLKTAFSNLESGTVKYVAADAVIGSYVVNASNYDAHIVALMEKPSGYCMGVSNTNTTLKTAVAKALATLEDNGTIGIVETKWLGTSMDLSKVSLTEGAKTATTSSTSTSSDSTSTSTDTSNAGANAVQIN